MRAPVLFLLMVFVSLLGLVWVAVSSIQEEQLLLERERDARTQRLAQTLRDQVREGVLNDARAADSALRELAREDQDPGALRARFGDVLVFDGDLELVVPTAGWTADPVREGPPTGLLDVLALEPDQPQAALEKLRSLPQEVRATPAGMNLESRLLVRVDQPAQALGVCQGLYHNRAAGERLRRVGREREIACLLTLERDGEARAATAETVAAIVSSGGRGETPGSTWAALNRLDGTAGLKIDSQAQDLRRLARLAAEVQALGDLDAERGLQALDAQFLLARHPERPGWLVIGPAVPLPSGSLRIVLAISPAALAKRLAQEVATQGVEEVYQVQLQAPPTEVREGESTRSLGLDAHLKIAPRASALDEELASSRTKQRLVILGAFLLLILVGSLLTWRSVRRSAALARLRQDFVASVTHELKTPLASIQAMADVLALDKVSDPAERESFYRGMASECRRLGRLINDVLDVSRIERGAFQAELAPHQPGDLVREVVEGFRPTAEEDGYALTCKIPDDLPDALLDRVLFPRALENLLANAVKYSEGQKQIEVELSAHNGWVEVAVQDRGVGIATDEQQRVFERFVRGRTAEGRTGAGLGLAIVAQILDAHGGSVHLDSQEGCRFTLRLPVAEDAK